MNLRCRWNPLLLLVSLALPLLVAAQLPGVAEPNPATPQAKVRSRPGPPPSTAPRISLPPREGSMLPPLKGGRIRNTGAYQREYWYWYERSRPSGVFPKGAELQARQRAQAFRQQFKSQAGVRKSSKDGLWASYLDSTPWVELGPRGMLAPDYGPGIAAGRLMSILFQKASNRITVGAASGGIWKRALTAGSVFTPQADFASNLSIGALAADPNNAQILYAGTGEPGVSTDSFDGAGLLKSTNGGVSWVRIDNGIFTATKISGVWVDPNNSSRVLASTLYGGGLYESVNGGVAWTLLLSGSVMGFQVAPNDRNRILLSRSEPFGEATHDLMLSINGGVNFTNVNGPWQGPGATVGRIDVAFAPSQPSIVWASVAPPIFGSDGGRAGVYRSTNGGASFSAVFPGNVQESSWYCNPMGVSPTDPGVIYVGGVDLYRGVFGVGLNKITNWYDGTGLPYIHADQHAVAFDPTTPGTVYVANDGGLFISTDDGASWTDMNAGLATTQFYYGCVGPNNGLASLFGGTQDNGSVRPTNGLEWTETIGGDGFQCEVDPQSPNVLYGSIYSSIYYMSINNGLSFFQLPDPPFFFQEGRPFFSPLAIDPSDGTKIYGGAQRVYRGISNRTNSVTWTALDTGALFPGEAIRRIAVAKTNGNVLYASAGAGLARTTTGNAPWTNVTPPGGQFITGVVVHPADASIVFCSRSGFSGGQVMRGTNGGTSWTDLSTGLPNVPVNNLAIRGNGNRLDAYLATDAGVYYADLNAATLSWSPVGSGLPHVSVYDVLLSDNNTKLIAVTHGRGMWSLPLVTSTPATPTNLAPTVLSTSSIKLTWTDNASNEQGFRLERALDSGFTNSLTTINVAAMAGTGGLVVYTNTGLQPNTRYYYRVRAYNGTVNSAYAGPVNAITNLLGAPTNLTAVGFASNRIDVTWKDNFAGETGFEIWASMDGGSFSLLTTVAANIQYYRHSGLTGSHTYAYQVRAITTANRTAFSNTATALLLAQPLGLNAQALNSTRIFIKWNDNATNEAVYEIWRKVGAGAFTLRHTAPANTPQFTDNTVVPNQTYAFQVRCRNGVHVSSYSNADTSPAMLAPTNLNGTVASSTRINLTWTDNSAALETSFQIFRRIGAGSWKMIGTAGANATSYADLTTKAGTAYGYQVRAASGNDWSSYSNIKTLNTP